MSMRPGEIGLPLKIVTVSGHRVAQAIIHAFDTSPRAHDTYVDMLVERSNSVARRNQRSEYFANRSILLIQPVPGRRRLVRISQLHIEACPRQHLVGWNMKLNMRSVDDRPTIIPSP
nr:hypothetical protein CFP56_31734 [Quercus suber]